ncbi:major facilitator superfamily domain-containing protein [Phyllosticta citriasiana]|uniref:major facilitator superfamily domain-containing protein n=1 Tax=Phyllosticta citriasiana TaxID=595635 RepID=UPI0030FDACB3
MAPQNKAEPNNGNEVSWVEQHNADSSQTSSDNGMPATKGHGKVKGRVAGGVYLQAVNAEATTGSDHGPLKEVECDMPLTNTEIVHKDGEEFILLKFAPGDKENPFNWPNAKKWFMSWLLCLMTLTIGLATTAYSSGISSMCSDFGVSSELGQLGLFFFNFVCAMSPMFLAPFCELVGRKVIYVGAYCCFCITFIGLALGKNIGTILVMRAFLGLFGCVGTILVGGTFDDMFEPRERSRAMALFSYVAILGTVAAPIYAGFIDETIGWRWVEGIQGLSCVPLLIVLVIFFRETRGGVTLAKRAKQLRATTNDQRYKAEQELIAKDIKQMLNASSVKAVKMLASEGVVLAFGLWISFAWFLTFLFLSVIPITFQEHHGWSEGVAGLPYISLCLGTTIGYGANFFQIKRYEGLVRANNGNVEPEARLFGALFGAPFLPIGLFIYTYTQYAFVHWMGPVVGLALIAIGIFFIFESCYSFTADCYGTNSSSAIAGQGLMRNTLAAVSPLFGSQFFHNLGSQWAGLLLSLVAVLLTFIPFVVYKYGPAIRARSKLAQSTAADDESSEEEVSEIEDEKAGAELSIPQH